MTRFLNPLGVYSANWAVELCWSDKNNSFCKWWTLGDIETPFFIRDIVKNDCRSWHNFFSKTSVWRVHAAGPMWPWTSTPDLKDTLQTSFRHASETKASQPLQYCGRLFLFHINPPQCGEDSLGCEAGLLIPLGCVKPVIFCQRQHF